MKVYFKIIVLFLLVFTYPVIHSFAQNESNNQEMSKFGKNEISVHGSYIFLTGGASVNYARTIATNEKFRTNISIGCGIITGAIVAPDLHGTIPVTIGLITGNKSNHFEANIGWQPFINGSTTNSNPGYRTTANPESGIQPGLPIINIGYRYQDHSSGIIFRIFIGSEGGLSVAVGGAF